MKIVYQTNQLCLRGTTVAVYDYAFYNMTLAGHQPIIIFDKNNVNNNIDIINKFVNTFGNDSVIGYNNFDDMNSIINNKGAELFYSIKGGWLDNAISNNLKNCIHAVFKHKQIHGNVYAYISEWLRDCMGGDLPFVPHIVNLPKVNKDLRGELNIPSNAFVIGRHGGADTFDIDFVKTAIKNTIDLRKDTYYIFVNTIPFMYHERIRYINNIADLERKSMFINTCDVGLHARQQGESFGLAIAEFSFLNKPVISFNGGSDLNHLIMLKDVGIFYNNQQELENILLNYTHDSSINYDVVSKKFSPENVVSIFDKVFIKG